MFVIQALFIVLWFATLVSLTRRRDMAHLEIAALFGTLGLSSLIGWVNQVAGGNPSRVGLVTGLLILLQPYLLLRMVTHFRRLAWTEHLLGMCGWLGSWVLLSMSAGDLSRQSVSRLAVVVAFAVVEGYASLAFVRTAIVRRGLMRRRLVSIATGSAALALLIVLSGVTLLVPQMTAALQTPIALLAIGALGGYYLGFAPPRWLCRAWQAAEFQAFLASLGGRSAEDRLVAAVDRVSDAAVQAVGGIGGFLLIGRDAHHVTVHMSAEIGQGASATALVIEAAAEPLIAHLWDTRRSTIEHHPDQWPSAVRTVARSLGGLKSLMLCPLVTHGGMYGVLVVAFQHRSPFQEDDLSLLQSVAEQMALTIESRDLLLASRHLAEQREILLELSQALADETDIRPITERIGQALATLFPDVHWGIFLPEPDGSLRIETAGPGLYPGKHLAPGSGIAGQVFATGIARLVDDVQKDASYVPLDPTTQSKLVVPLRHGRQTIGVLVFESAQAGRFTVEDQALVEIIAADVALAVVRGQLLDRIQAKNAELEAANDALANASRLKSEFLANMSHELRTPLNGIIGFAQLMHDGRVGPVADEHHEYLGYILSSGQHLLQLINDVLDLSKVEAGKMEFRPESLDIRKLIDEAVESLGAVAREKSIEVSVRIDPVLGPLTADPNRLKQIVLNYLSNALKFTPDQGQVTISVRPEGDAAFRLEVADTGIGIAPQEIARLFGEFQQLDAGSDKRYQGTGLGLALTKRLAEAQGGQVGVTSTVGSGSCFFVTLPRIAATEPDTRAETNDSDAPRGAPVLVVEDDPADAAWLTDVLGQAGYAVTVADSATRALELCTERRFSAITLDLILPDAHGWDVLRGVRGSALNADVPVVVVTVLADRGLVNGFAIQDFLTKPVSAEDLLEALTRAGVHPNKQAPILVVDDDPTALRLMEATLTQLGYAFRGALDSETGLRLAAEAPPAAVVLDLLMPGTDGFQFLDQLRKTRDGARTPVVVWTSKDLSAEELHRLRGETQEIVTKGAGGTAPLLDALRTLVPLEQEPPSARLPEPV